MQQPSAQGIASLFRGNPEPLQQRIQQEQQAKPGLPPDLQKLLALNIVTNEKDAVAKQQAMSQLSQMQGPQGQPPTVMQSVQEQAKQAIQAQAVQAQQQQQAQQQGLQALTQQQPQQGIDQLPVEFQMAGGGIVAFKKGGEGEYETPYDRMNRENREQAEAEEEARLARVRELGNETMPYGEQMSRLGKALGGIPAEVLKTITSAPGYGLSRLLFDEKAPAPVEAARKEVLPEAAPRIAVEPQPEKPAQKPAMDLRDLDNLQRPRPQRVAAPIAPAAQAAATPEAATPAPESLAMQTLGRSLTSDPEAARVAEQERRKKEVGSPDTTQYDRLIDELEKRKSQFEGPKDQWGQLMEYFGQIAQAPRGLSSFEAGAQGAAGVKKLQEARQLEQFNLSKQAVEVSQKKLDTVRAFAEKQYDVGKSVFDEEFKKQFDAAKLIAGNEQEARKLAQENTLKRLEISSAEARNAASNATQLQAANIGQARTYAEEARNKQYQDLMAMSRKLTASGDKAGAAEAAARAADIAAIGGRGGAGAGSAVAGDRQELAELKTLLKNAEDTASNHMLTKATREAAAQRMTAINNQIASMTRLGAQSTSSQSSQPTISWNDIKSPK